MITEMNAQINPGNINLQFAPNFNYSKSFQKLFNKKNLKKPLFTCLQPYNGQQNDNSKSNKKKKIRMRFSPEEDEILINLVSTYGDQDWNKISAELTKQSPINKQRTPRQCKDRYINYLSPEITNSEWTSEEDQLLIFNFLQTPSHWKSMKILFPGRSEVAIKNRFKYLYKEGLNVLKPMIKEKIPSPAKEIEPNKQVQNLTKVNSNLAISPISSAPNHFLKQINKNLGPVTTNRVKTMVRDLFHTTNCPPCAPKAKCTKETSESLPESFENESSLFPQNITNDSFQIESDNESYDTLNLFDMF